MFFWCLPLLGKRIQFDKCFSTWFETFNQQLSTNVFGHPGIAMQELQHKRSLEIAQDETAGNSGVVPFWKDPGWKVGGTTVVYAENSLGSGSCKGWEISRVLFFFLCLVERLKCNDAPHVGNSLYPNILRNADCSTLQYRLSTFFTSLKLACLTSTNLACLAEQLRVEVATFLGPWELGPKYA